MIVEAQYLIDTDSTVGMHEVFFFDKKGVAVYKSDNLAPAIIEYTIIIVCFFFLA